MGSGCRQRCLSKREINSKEIKQKIVLCKLFAWIRKSGSQITVGVHCGCGVRRGFFEGKSTGNHKLRKVRTGMPSVQAGVGLE